jgi:outer membrane protein assembly factor BamB
MSTPQTIKPTRKLRLWPGVIAVIVQWLGWYAVPFLFPQAIFVGMLIGLGCALAIIVWWLFFSRAPWLERIAPFFLMVLGVIITKRIVHPSIAGGMMGMMLPIFSIPILSMSLVAWAVSTGRLSALPRRALMIVAIAIGCGVFTLVRTGGISGDANSDLHWRWTKTPEEKLLAQANDQPLSAASVPAPVSSAGNPESGWPGFRGPNRDGVVHGIRLETNWSQKPPVGLWRRPIGPGWSSFAVQDNLVYTQEQRGENEVVSCYNLSTGQPVWRHNDAARFYESNAGAGPRGTPTLHGDRVYTFGATGILNALDARNGSVIWTRNAASDTKAKVPHWGFASSPLVLGDVVIVAAAGSLAAYDAATGNPLWYGPSGGRGYSSPQVLTIGGVEQVLLMNGDGVISVNPADGSLLWKHPWDSDSIVQPAVTTNGDVLLGSGSGLGSEVGVLRLAVARESNGWTAKPLWKSDGLMPYFNDFVVHKDYAFGFDGDELGCIDLKDGSSKWKGGSFGHGQVVLLADQDLLLVISEGGELALVNALPDQFNELARMKVIGGKTWNHPVLVGETLLVRNGEEMAAFRMPLLGR